MKILIGSKEQRSGYFEIAYTFTLDVPQSQKDALAKNNETVKTTVEQTGVAGYANGTTTKSIQEDLIKRFNKAQEDLNIESKFELYGMSYDGSKWA